MINHDDIARVFRPPQIKQSRQLFPYILKIECIGDGSPRAVNYGAWEIYGFGSSGQIDEHRLNGHKDYSQGNSVGTRGVFIFYMLYSEHVYRIIEPKSWNHIDHYYCRIQGNHLIHMTFKEAFRWLSYRSE